MEIKEFMMNKILYHFHINNQNDCEFTQLKTLNDFNPFPYIHNEKTTEDYIIYDMSSSFQFNLYDYSNDSTSSITFDSLFEVYYKEKTKQNPHIDFLHKQNFYMLTYVIDGQMNLILEGKVHVLPKGTCCITNRNVKQVEERRSEFTAVHLCIKSDFIEGLQFLNTKPANSGTELIDFFHSDSLSEQISYLIFQPLHTSELADELMKMIFLEMSEKEIGYLELCKLYLQRLFALLQTPSHYLCLTTRFSLSQEKTLFEETLKYITDHKKKVTREEIGKALSYNGNYISAVFQKYAGVTLAKYIRELCLSQAAHLLLNTEMQIKEIIDELGYENKTAFYKNFHEKYGMNPGEYRNRTSRK